MNFSWVGIEGEGLIDLEFERGHRPDADARGRRCGFVATDAAQPEASLQHRPQRVIDAVRRINGMNEVGVAVKAGFNFIGPLPHTTELAGQAQTRIELVPAVGPGAFGFVKVF
jgi:hypothetical protein